MKTQHQMYYDADARIRGICRTYNEIQQGPNPITPEEVDRLIEKRPEVYGVLRNCGAQAKGNR
jgi:hypothetical protein